MRGNQIIVHVIRVRCGKSDPLETVNLVELPNQIGQGPCPAIRGAMIGVHILPQQRDFAHTAINQTFGFINHTLRRAAHFGAARIGHNAKSTEFIASLLDGQKRCWRALGLGAIFEHFELILDREIGIEGLLPLARLFLQLGQPVIALRPNDQID